MKLNLFTLIQQISFHVRGGWLICTWWGMFKINKFVPIQDVNELPCPRGTTRKMQFIVRGFAKCRSRCRAPAAAIIPPLLRKKRGLIG